MTQTTDNDYSQEHDYRDPIAQDEYHDEELYDDDLTHQREIDDLRMELAETQERLGKQIVELQTNIEHMRVLINAAVAIPQDIMRRIMLTKHPSPFDPNA